jgi:hypothetical protein
VSGNTSPAPPSRKWFTKRFIKIPVWLWIVGGFFLIGVIADGTKSPDEQAKGQSEVSLVENSISTSTSSTVISEQRISVDYKNLNVDCSGSDLQGTVDVFNSGNVSISGRVEVPVETEESFTVPLSGVFLDVPASATVEVTLKSAVGCREDQVVGQPFTAFTIPSIEKLQKINVQNAFKWSEVRAQCDYESTWVRLEATVTNISSFELTAGFAAYLQNGPLSEGQKKAGLRGTLYRGNVWKIQPGESRKIKFGYGDFCMRGTDDGPYFTEFETVFTY